MEMMNYNSAFINSLLMSVLTGVLHVSACTLTAYSLAKFNFPLKKLFYIAVVMTFFIPPQLLSVPTYSVFKNFDIFGLLRIVLPKGINLLDNPVSLLFLYGTANALKSGLFIYLMIQYFRNIPKELDEAAAVDGASLSRTFLSVVIPSSRVMLVTIFLFTFVWQWTDLQYTSMFFKEFEVLSTKLQFVGQTYALFLQGQGAMDNPLLVSQMVSAGSIVFMVPLLILYIICNKFFVQGIERSGIVG
jgi:multiple sugar transport system permease protein